MTNLIKNLLEQLKYADESEIQSRLLSEFYNQTSHLPYKYCLKKGISLENTEDIVQTVYLKIYKLKHQYNPEHSPLAWLYVITRSETKDALKKIKRYKSKIEDFSVFLSQTPISNPSSRQEELEGWSLLTDKEKDILIRRYKKDEDFEEISIHHKTSVHNIRKIVSRAIQKLRKGENHGI